MTMTMDELMKVLDMQEDILQFTHFTNADAWELGTMILMEARRRGAQVGIMIRRSNGEVVFQYCDNGITQCGADETEEQFGASDGAEFAAALHGSDECAGERKTDGTGPEGIRNAGRRFSDLRGRSRRCGNRSSVRHGTGFGS